MENIIQVRNMIYEVRGQKVMIDFELAELYEVETKMLNRAVKRNQARFPQHFMFQLTSEEYEALKVRCQIGTSPKGGGRQYLPYVFTEQGVAMLSSVLRSERAIQINIQIMDTFVKMREWAIENKEMSQKLAELEHYFMEHCRDHEKDKAELQQHLNKIYEAIGLLMDRTKPSHVGFSVE